MVATGQSFCTGLFAWRVVAWLTAGLSTGKVGTGRNALLLARASWTWFVAQMFGKTMRAAKQALSGAAICHSNAGHGAKMSTHTIHLDIKCARPVDASGEAVLALAGTLVATHQDHTALFSAFACSCFTTYRGMGVATLASILGFFFAVTCTVFATTILASMTAWKLMSAWLLAQILIWILPLKTSDLANVPLRTNHLYKHPALLSADFTAFFPAPMTTGKLSFTGHGALNAEPLVALNRNIMSTFHGDRNKVCTIA